MCFIVATTCRGTISLIKCTDYSRTQILMIFAIVKAMVPFVIMLFTAIHAFSMVFITIDYYDNKYHEKPLIFNGNYKLALLFVYNICLGNATKTFQGEFDKDDNEIETEFEYEEGLGFSMQLLVQMFFTIGILNIVISVVTEIYESFLEKEVVADQKTKLAMMLELGDLLWWRRDNENKNARFIYFARHPTRDDVDEIEDEAKAIPQQENADQLFDDLYDFIQQKKDDKKKENQQDQQISSLI